MDFSIGSILNFFLNLCKNEKDRKIPIEKIGFLIKSSITLKKMHFNCFLKPFIFWLRLFISRKFESFDVKIHDLDHHNGREMSDRCTLGRNYDTFQIIIMHLSLLLHNSFRKEIMIITRDSVEKSVWKSAPQAPKNWGYFDQTPHNNILIL